MNHVQRRQQQQHQQQKEEQQQQQYHHHHHPDKLPDRSNDHPSVRHVEQQSQPQRRHHYRHPSVPALSPERRSHHDHHHTANLRHVSRHHHQHHLDIDPYRAWHDFYEGRQKQQEEQKKVDDDVSSNTTPIVSNKKENKKRRFHQGILIVEDKVSIEDDVDHLTTDPRRVESNNHVIICRGHHDNDADENDSHGSGDCDDGTLALCKKSNIATPVSTRTTPSSSPSPIASSSSSNAPTVQFASSSCDALHGDDGHYIEQQSKKLKIATKLFDSSSCQEQNSRDYDVICKCKQNSPYSCLSSNSLDSLSKEPSSFTRDDSVASNILMVVVSNKDYDASIVSPPTPILSTSTPVWQQDKKGRCCDVPFESMKLFLSTTNDHLRDNVNIDVANTTTNADYENAVDENLVTSTSGVDVNCPRTKENNNDGTISAYVKDDRNSPDVIDVVDLLDYDSSFDDYILDNNKQLASSNHRYGDCTDRETTDSIVDLTCDDVDEVSDKKFPLLFPKIKRRDGDSINSHLIVDLTHDDDDDDAEEDDDYDYEMKDNSNIKMDIEKNKHSYHMDQLHSDQKQEHDSSHNCTAIEQPPNMSECAQKKKNAYEKEGRTTTKRTEILEDTVIEDSLGDNCRLCPGVDVRCQNGTKGSWIGTVIRVINDEWIVVKYLNNFNETLPIACVEPIITPDGKRPVRLRKTPLEGQSILDFRCKYEMKHTLTLTDKEAAELYKSTNEEIQQQEQVNKIKAKTAKAKDGKHDTAPKNKNDKNRKKNTM